VAECAQRGVYTKGSRRNMTLSLCSGSTPPHTSANYIWIILIRIIYGLSRHLQGKNTSSHVSYSLNPYSTVPKELRAIEWTAKAAQSLVNTFLKLDKPPQPDSGKAFHNILFLTSLISNLTFWGRDYFFNFSTPCIKNMNNTGTK